jgi:hypothetical protein
MVVVVTVVMVGATVVVEADAMVVVVAVFPTSPIFCGSELDTQPETKTVAIKRRANK